MPPDGDEPDPRFSLANERTLLAYNRTALALVVAGSALSGSTGFADTPKWLAAIGIPLIALGGWVAATSRGRFIAVQRAMRENTPIGAPPAASFLPWGIAVVALAAAVAAVVGLA